MKDIYMKLAWTIAAAITAVSNFPLTAQQAGLVMQQATSADAGGTQAGEPSETDASAAAPLLPVNGELEGKLDAKTAKIGDRVVVKTKASVKTEDGMEIPKNSKLIGKVTEVQAHGVRRHQQAFDVCLTI